MLIKDIKLELLQDVPFCEEYEDVKTNPNVLWDKYYKQIDKFCTAKAISKGVDKNELIQQCYLYFITYCKRYNPYYNDGFYHFDRGVFKHLIMNCQAFIQRYYVKKNREPLFFNFVDSNEYTANQTVGFDNKNYIHERENFKSNIDKYEDIDEINSFLSLLDERSQKILKLMYIEGLNQSEISKIIGISQSRISVIASKSLDKLYRVANGKNINDKTIHRPSKKVNKTK